MPEALAGGAGSSADWAKGRRHGKKAHGYRDPKGVQFHAVLLSDNATRTVSQDFC